MMTDPKEQFSLIYDQYIDKIYRFVYLKVSSEEAAEDVTSKVFLKYWESCQKGQKIKNPAAFLYQIARNLVVDHYREKGRSKVVPMDNAPEIIDQGKNSHDQAVLHEDIDKIKLAIRKLEKGYQDIVIWYYLDDMSAEQIAQMIDRPAGTVRVMLHRGLKALKDAMGGQG